MAHNFNLPPSGPADPNLAPPIALPQAPNILVNPNVWGPPAVPVNTSFPAPQNISPNQPAVSRFDLIKTRAKVGYLGLRSAVAKSKKERAEFKEGLRARDESFYRSLGALARRGSPLSGAQPIVAPEKAKTGPQRQHEQKVSRKLDKANKAHQNLTRDIDNSGIRKGVVTGKNIDKMATKLAIEAIEKKYRRGELTISQRDVAIAKKRANPILKDTTYRAKKHKQFKKAEKSLHKSGNNFQKMALDFASDRQKQAAKAIRHEQRKNNFDLRRANAAYNLQQLRIARHAQRQAHP